MDFLIQTYNFNRPVGQTTGDYDSVNLSVITTSSTSLYFNKTVQITKAEWETARVSDSALSDLIKSKAIASMNDEALVIAFGPVNENSTNGKANINFNTSGTDFNFNGYVQTTIEAWRAARASDEQISALIKQAVIDQLNGAAQA
jgi:hypothetical protein